MLSRLLCALAFASASLTAAFAPAADLPVDRPNVVLILIDDMGWRDLGCSGSTFYQTPSIDALARAGMRFTNAYAAAPICSPTRASILTGQYPARLGMTDWLPGRRDSPEQKLLRPTIAQHLPERSTTLAEALRERGYRTASIGKWHLGGAGNGPEQNGFDVNLGGTQSGSPTGGYFRFESPTLRLNAGEYLTDRLTDEAARFITENRDRPFFVYLAHYAVHIPLQAKEEVIERHRNRAPPDQFHRNPVYAAMIESVDESVGRIIRKLDELKIADRTMAIFTSDNGGLSVKEGPHTPATSNVPLRAGKGHLYEGGIRVPLVVQWPGVAKPASICDVPVFSADLYSTIVTAAGASGNDVVDGQSLLPLLKQDTGFKSRSLFWHYPHYSNQGGKPSGAIREGDWKLVEFFEEGRTELYNLGNDPAESKDLATERPDKIAAIKSKLSAWRAETNAKMPESNPDYVGGKP